MTAPTLSPAQKRAPKCPECCGDGWVVSIVLEAECCHGSDWECGARGCTGPVPVEVHAQEQCEACEGSGLALRAALMGDKE